MKVRLPLWEQMWVDSNIPYTKVHEEMFQELQARYREPHRHYHSLRHIGFCLDRFREVKTLVRDPLGLQLAIWFHDAVYEPGSPDNERKSAELFTRFAEEIALPVSLTEFVTRTIWSTTHQRKDRYFSPDAFLMIDIDLSPLARPEEEFDADTRNYRKEFPNLSDEEFLYKSHSFLRMIAERTSIYSTQYFRMHYEEQARANLRRVLAP